LSRLQEEYYELKRTGYAGEGFFSNGRRLGAGAGIPQTGAALIAQQRSIELEIAERRRTNTVPGTNGPVRLGGGNLASLGLTPRELAVLVRRRMRSPRDLIISLSFLFLRRLPT
jgi:DNA-dependent metalloprotease WSS1